MAAVRTGALREDPKQVLAMTMLDELHVQMSQWTPPPPPPPPGSSSAGGSSGGGGGGGMFASLSSMFGGGGGKASAEALSADSKSDTMDLSGVTAPRGLYMYGGVGVGKSLLMDTFFDCSTIPEERKRCAVLPPAPERRRSHWRHAAGGQTPRALRHVRRRIHFHEFMQEMHGRMHKLRKERPDVGDPLPHIAHDIAASTQLLCFDEFQVTDVADALVSRRPLIASPGPRPQPHTFALAR